MVVSGLGNSLSMTDELLEACLPVVTEAFARRQSTAYASLEHSLTAYQIPSWRAPMTTIRHSPDSLWRDHYLLISPGDPCISSEETEEYPR